jgi:hypothetical protein
MAAPTNAALVKKVLANSEPSTHGPKHGFHPLKAQLLLSGPKGALQPDVCF